MKIEKKKLNELISPEWNPRDMSDEELDKLENSIKTFGFNNPLIVNKRNNHIIAGNQRFKILKRLNYTEVDCVIVDIPDYEEKAFNIADNKISGEFNDEKLQVILEEIELSPIDVKLTGFEDFELDFYLDDGMEFDNPFDYDDEDDDDDVPEDFADVEGDNSETQYICYISFETQDEANEFLRWLNAPYEMNKTSVGLHSSEITWGNQE